MIKAYRDDLHKCPRCGGKMEITYRENCFKNVLIKCPECGAQGYPCCSESDAIKNWNKIATIKSLWD